MLKQYEQVLILDYSRGLEQKFQNLKKYVKEQWVVWLEASNHYF